MSSGKMRTCHLVVDGDWLIVDSRNVSSCRDADYDV